MPEGRPAIPAELKRRVKMEAGHRCAIPTCRSVPVEIAHIVPYAEVQEHEFENLIALCPTCHTRYDRHDIDRISMKGYKANLGLVSGRYGEIERRLLDNCALSPTITGMCLPPGWDLALLYLVKDGIIEKKRDKRFFDGSTLMEFYELTPTGREFIKNWVAAKAVSPEAEIEDGSGESDDQDEPR